MTKKIYKYPLETADRQKLILPKGAQILTVQEQHGQPYVWALIDPLQEETKDKDFRNKYESIPLPK